MASIHKDPKGYSKFWYAAYTTATGQRKWRSTKETDKTKALAIANALQAAERAVQSGGNVEEQLRKLFNETLERAGLRKIEVIRLKDWLTRWLAEVPLRRSRSTTRRPGKIYRPEWQTGLFQTPDDLYTVAKGTTAYLSTSSSSFFTRLTSGENFSGYCSARAS